MGHKMLLVSWLIVMGLATSGTHADDRPRLVVVVSVDQLCHDYLVRFADNYSADGLFHRVFDSGAQYTQCRHRQAYTVTATGHSVQLTGAYPNASGMVGNEWFDRQTGKEQYCVADPEAQIVGAVSGKGVSPRGLLVETVGDVIRTTDADAKVFGVGIKDRAAILMSGHKANAVFWLQDGQWVTSSYYRQDMPGYLRVVNASQPVTRYQGRVWELQLPQNRYHNQAPDKNEWESPPKGMTGEFPHRVAAAGSIPAEELANQVLDSPFGNEITLEAAREIVSHEKLGLDEHPDLLCINISSTDFVGHAYGPDSLEIEDMIYQTDRQLGEFARFLDQQVGTRRWTMAVTADHGVAPIVEYAVRSRLPAKREPLGSTKGVQVKLEQLLCEKLHVGPSSTPLVQHVSEAEVYLNHDHPVLQGEKLAEAKRLVRDWLQEQPYVAVSATSDDLRSTGDSPLLAALHLQYHPQHSGDVLTVFAPYCVPGTRGTTHGSPWEYDTHVPLLLVGAGVKPGAYERPVSPACLASTVAELVHVPSPNGNVESPLREALGR
jgi:predicted AlkP superfamily pyrophosphatase or phosphodiesterase